MYCSKCGKQIDDDAFFCSFCGQQIKEVDNKEFFANEKQTIQNENATNKKPFSVIVLGLIIGFFGIAIFSGIIIVGLLIYQRVYLFDGYDFTQVLCWLSMALMTVGLIVTVTGLIAKRNNHFDRTKKRTIASIIEIILTIVFIITGSISAVEELAPRSSSSSYSSSSGSNGSINAYSYALAYLKTSNVSITHNSSYTVCTGTITNTGSYTIKYVKIKGTFQNYSGTTYDTAWTYAVGAEGLDPGESTTFRMSVSKNTNIKKCVISIMN